MHILSKILWKLCVGTCLLEPNVATPLGTDTDLASTRNLGHEKSKILPIPVRGVRVREREEMRKCVDAARSLLSLMNSRDLGDDITGWEVPVPESSSCEEEISTVVQTELCGETIFSMGKELYHLTLNVRHWKYAVLNTVYICGIWSISGTSKCVDKVSKTYSCIDAIETQFASAFFGGQVWNFLWNCF